MAPGQMINLISNDMQRIQVAAIYLHYMYAIFLQTIILCYMTYDFTGISGIPGLLFVILEGIVIQGNLLILWF